MSKNIHGVGWHYKGCWGNTWQEAYNKYQAYMGAKRYHAYMNNGR